MKHFLNLSLLQLPRFVINDPAVFFSASILCNVDTVCRIYIYI